MEKKHKKNGLEIYEGDAGNQKGKWYARAWMNGEIVAESEGYTKRIYAATWLRRVTSIFARTG